MEGFRYHGYSEAASEEVFQCRNKSPRDRWGRPVPMVALLIFIAGFLIFCQRVQAVELTLLYSNDMRGIIDPCPT